MVRLRISHIAHRYADEEDGGGEVVRVGECVDGNDALRQEGLSLVHVGRRAGEVDEGLHTLARVCGAEEHDLLDSILLPEVVYALRADAAPRRIHDAYL